MTLISCAGGQKNRLELLDRYMQGQVQHNRFNGNILVAEGGKIIFQKSYGVRDFRSGQPLNDSSVFMLASASKQFTAAGILLLENQGKLDVQDSLSKYFPELPYKVTLHHLLTHTSGLPDYEFVLAQKWNKINVANNNDVIALLASEKLPLNFRPGTRWEYSNTGYVLLASVIEKVSGVNYADFLTASIFAPLGMAHTGVFNPRTSQAALENYAFGFVRSGDSYVLPDSLPAYDFVRYEAGVVGDGSLSSTTGDLYRWDRALEDKTLLAAGVIEKMTAPHALSDTTANVSYGYGFFVGLNQLGSYVSHPGYWPGYETSFAKYKEGDRTIVVLSNNEVPARFIQAGLANLLFGRPVELPYAHKVVPADSLALNAFAGTFTFNGWFFELVPRGDTVFQSFGPGYGRVYLPESDMRVFPIDGQDILFEIEKTNAEVKHYVVVHGVREEMKEIAKKDQSARQ